MLELKIQIHYAINVKRFGDRGFLSNPTMKMNRVRLSCSMCVSKGGINATCYVSDYNLLFYCFCNCLPGSVHSLSDTVSLLAYNSQTSNSAM